MEDKNPLSPPLKVLMPSPNGPQLSQKSKELLYNAVAQYATLPQDLSITPKQSFKLKSQQRNQIMILRKQGSPKPQAFSQKKNPELRLPKSFIERYQKHQAALYKKITPQFDTISQEYGSIHDQITDIMQRHEIGIGFIKTFLKESFRRLIIWQIYYYQLKQESKQFNIDLDSEKMKFLENFYESERQKINELFPGQLEKIMSQSVFSNQFRSGKSFKKIIKQICQQEQYRPNQKI